MIHSAWTEGVHNDGCDVVEVMFGNWADGYRAVREERLLLWSWLSARNEVVGKSGGTVDQEDHQEGRDLSHVDVSWIRYPCDGWKLYCSEQSANECLVFVFIHALDMSSFHCSCVSCGARLSSFGIGIFNIQLLNAGWTTTIGIQHSLPRAPGIKSTSELRGLHRSRDRDSFE